MRDTMKGAKRSDARGHREHLQRRSAPAVDDPNVHVIPERALRVSRVGTYRQGEGRGGEQDGRRHPNYRWVLVPKTMSAMGTMKLKFTLTMRLRVWWIL